MNLIQSASNLLLSYQAHLLPNFWFSIQLGKYLTNVLLKKEANILPKSRKLLFPNEVVLNI